MQWINFSENYARGVFLVVCWDDFNMVDITGMSYMVSTLVLLQLKHVYNDNFPVRKMVS